MSVVDDPHPDPVETTTGTDRRESGGNPAGIRRESGGSVVEGDRAVFALGGDREDRVRVRLRRRVAVRGVVPRSSRASSTGRGQAPLTLARPDRAGASGARHGWAPPAPGGHPADARQSCSHLAAGSARLPSVQTAQPPNGLCGLIVWVLYGSLLGLQQVPAATIDQRGDLRGRRRQSRGGRRRRGSRPCPAAALRRRGKLACAIEATQRTLNVVDHGTPLGLGAR